MARDSIIGIEHINIIVDTIGMHFVLVILSYYCVFSFFNQIFSVPVIL